MWAGQSTPPLPQTRTRVHSSPLLAPPRSIMRVLVLFCCIFLVVIDIEIVTSMSLDRLGIDRNNELQSDKPNDMNENKNSELVVEDLELEAVPAGGETEMYVLLPAGSKSERESVNKNTIESDDAETVNVAETDGDMVMMESNDTPVVQIANLPPPIMGSQKDIVNVQTTGEDEGKANDDEPTTSEESDDEPIKQVFKNDKDIEDMAFENDKDYSDDISTVTQTSGDDKNDSDEESESVVDMLADVVEEVEKEIETELEEDTDTTADKVVDMLVGDTESTADKVVDMLVEDTDATADKVVGMLVEDTDSTADRETKDEEKVKWEETVEKIEEMGAEKNKDEDDDIELEAAAVMEEILPEEVVEAMAVAEANDNSSEEKDQEEVDKVDIKNPKGSSEQTQEDIMTEGTKRESSEIIKPESNEEVKKEESKEPTEEVEKTENELDTEKFEGLINEDVENQKLEETAKIKELETNALKDEIVEEPTETTIKEEEEEKEHSENTEQDAEILSNTDKVVEDLKENHSLENNELETEEANNAEPEEISDSIGNPDLLNKVETPSEIEEENVNPDSQQQVSEEMTTESPNSNVDNEIDNSVSEEKLQLPQLETNKQSDEENLMAEPEAVNNESNKSEEIIKIESSAPEIQQTETMNEAVSDHVELESAQPVQLPQLNDPMDDSEIKNIEEINKSDTLVEGEMQILNKPDESDQSSQILQETEIQSSAEDVPSAETTMLTTILQVPTQQQLQQQDEMPAIQEEIHVEDTKETNEQIVSNMDATPQITIPSSTQRPQIVISTTQDTVLSYVNATNALQSLQSEKEQQKQHMQQAEVPESDNQVFTSQLRRYDGAQVWRIVVQNDRDRRLADELQSKYDGQLWKEVKQEVDYLLKPQVLADAEKHIRAANLSRIVLIDNLQQVIEVENPPLDELADADSEKGHRLTWHAYHRLADIHEFFDYLAKTYPEICAVETIGYSVQKRPLKVLKISNGNAGNPGVWIDGGMHAREWISPASVTYIANQLAEGWENLPSYMKNINWYIHAVANPDGYEYTHTTDRLWRKNMRSHGRQCPGVDLNRNFGYKWGGKGTSANPCSQTYRGSKAFSEPETFYISKFISGFPRDTFQAFLSFHSYGQYILYPWGFDYMLTNDRSDLDRVARAAATTITRSTGVKYTVGPSALTLYPAAGGSDDWAKGIANIKYTYTIEMGDSGQYGFILPASHIETNGKDAYTFVQTVARAISHDVRKRNMKLK